MTFLSTCLQRQFGLQKKKKTLSFLHTCRAILGGGQMMLQEECENICIQNDKYNNLL